MARRIRWLGIVTMAASVACSPAVPPASTAPTTQPSAAGDGSDATPTDAIVIPAAAEIRGAERIDDRHGWLTTATGLFLTDDGGATWRLATPVDAATEQLVGATFADPDHGWLATAVPDPAATTFEIWRTHDGGRSWDRAVVPEGINRGDLMGTVWFSIAASGGGDLFAMAEGGMPTGYTGDLFESTDDGATWTADPILQDSGVTGPIAFADRRHGVVAGGAPGDRLFATDDGGRTWRRVPLPAPIGFADTITQFQDAPTFWSDHAGGVPVVIGNTERATAIVVLTTDDGGGTWRIAGTVPLAPDNGAVVAALPDPARWLVVTGGLGAVVTDDGGATWSRLEATGLPAIPDELSMSDPTHGWAIVRVSGCLTFKSDCSTRSGLFSTDDGGATWSLIWPQPS